MLAEIDPFWHKELHQSEMNHLQKLTPFDIKKFINQKWIIWHVLKHLLFRQKASPLLGWGISSRAAELIPTVIQRYFIFLPSPRGVQRNWKRGVRREKKMSHPPQNCFAPPFSAPPSLHIGHIISKRCEKGGCTHPSYPPCVCPWPPLFYANFSIIVEKTQW